MARDEGGSQGAEKQQISERDIRILFVTQKESALASTLKYLTKRQWKYSVVETMKAALEIMQSPEKPTHIFISFTVPQIHAKVEYFLKNTFAVVPVLFSEQFESTTYSQMRKIGFEHTILSPISGPTVQMKVRNTAKILEDGASGNRQREKKSASEESLDERLKRECPIDALPENGHWLKAVDKDPPVWRFSTFHESKYEQKEGVFYYEGSNPPAYDNGKWQRKEPGGRLFFVPKAVRTKKERRKNWWESAEDSELVSTKKDRSYKYMITPSHDRENWNPKKDAGEQKATDHGAGGETTIYIRPWNRTNKTPSWLQPNRSDEIAYSPFDKSGAVHPFFERAADFDYEEWRGKDSDSDDSIREHEDSRTSRLGPMSLLKGEKNSQGMLIEKGARSRNQSATQSGQNEGDDEAITQSGPDQKGDPLQINKGEADSGDVQVAKGKRRSRGSVIQHGNDGKKGEAYEGGEGAESGSATQFGGEGVQPGQKIENEQDESDPGNVKAKSSGKMSGKTEADGEREKHARAFGRRLNSILAESSIRTLGDMSSKEPNVIEIKNTKRLGVIPVDLGHTKGVLLVAMGNNREIGEELLKDIKQLLTHHLKMRGQDLSSTEDLEVLVEEVDFVDWAKVEMDFLALDQLGNEQVGLAFLSGDDIIPEVSESVEESMLAVDMACILPEVAITFDIYIYMQKNNRYIRYVQKGRRIEPHQIERLRDFEAEYFHIKKEDLRAFKSYCAANYINVLIRDSRISKAG